MIFAIFFLTLSSFSCQDKLDTDFKEVSSNQNCQEKLLSNASKHNNLKEEDKCYKISIEDSNLKVPNTTKVSIQNTNKLDLSSEYITKNVPKKSKASPVQLFAENTAVHKVIIFNFTAIIHYL